MTVVSPSAVRKARPTVWSRWSSGAETKTAGRCGPGLARMAAAMALRPALGRLAYSKLVRFLSVGLVGLSVDGGCFHLMAARGMGEPLARALSLGLATMVTWRLNRLFTFGASGRWQPNEGLRYSLVAFGAQGVSYATFLTLRGAAPDLPALAALLIGAVVATSFSFLGQRAFTFSVSKRA
jgi:putative flippase GtrA